MNGISVIVCCYNSVERLRPTLEHLSKQLVSKTTNWEIILVDNNSNDGTATYAQDVWNKCNSDISFSIVLEKQPGLSFARKTGMNTAKYNYVLFCDDDNWLRKDYIQTAAVILEKNPQIGILGGFCKAAANVDFPTWFDEQQAFYAIGEQEWKNRMFDGIVLVHGAGMVLNKNFYINCIQNGFKPLLTDRLKNKLTSGGDTEICYVMNLMGYKTHYSSDLFLTHFIPSERLTIDYLLRLRKGTILSSIIIAAYRDHLLEKPKRNIFYLFTLIFKFILLLPQFIYGFISNNIPLMIKFYYCFYNIKYYNLYSTAWDKIDLWKKQIKAN